MSLLFDEDYEYLDSIGLEYQEDEENRFLIINNYPVRPTLYQSGGQEIREVEVLVVIPGNYNATGNDMFWVYPQLTKMDGSRIPAVMLYGENDPRYFNGKEYCRWSRHANDWKPKIDTIEKIIHRIEWALTNPTANG